MKQAVKKALGDWRIPAIFAVPVLLWAGLLWAVLQPLPSATASGAGSGITFIGPKTTFPVASPVTILQTVPPTTPQQSTCAHQTIGYIIRTEGGVVVHAQPGIVCP